ncbi:MAG: dihydrodipicolinate reductase [Chlamydiota bacterium]
MTTHKIRVIQYGIGPIGAGIVRLMLQKPEIQIIGAIDLDPQKIGKDLGRIVGAERDLGVIVGGEARDVLRAGAHVVVHSTSSYLPKVSDQLLGCLQAGSHVVSTCEELAYPFRKHPELSQQLDRAAREHRVSLLGTGVNPGFAMDKLVLTLSTACQEVRQVKVRRVVDASRRRLPLQKKVGAGMTVDEFQAQVRAGVIKHHGLPESAAMIADSLGLRVDDIAETIEPVVAQESVRSEFLEVPAGRVKGVRQVARGSRGGEESVRLELEMYLGAREPVDSIEISGVPDLKLAIPGGIHGDLATAAIAVNCIPAMLEAKPGLLTSRDIPMRFLPGVAKLQSVGA